MIDEKKTLIIFAREPILGEVKTRLLKRLPAKTVTRLYKAFIRDTLATAAQVGCQKRIIYCTGPSQIPFLRQFKNKFLFKRQTSGHLGQRMYRAFKRTKEEGDHKIVIIGTDSPSLMPADIERAFRQLSRYDVVLGPSRDGGYYLIGLHSPDKSLFWGVPWGGPNVLKVTLIKAGKFNKTVYLLKKRDDLDTYDSLKKFYKNRGNRKNAVRTDKVIQHLFNRKSRLRKTAKNKK